MKIIKKLCKMIDEELDDACNYIQQALKYKEDYPSVAKAFATLSEEEMGHVGILHGEVTKLIEAHRREHGEPPETMKAVYDYLHEQHIEKANRVRMYQDQYRNY